MRHIAKTLLALCGAAAMTVGQARAEVTLTQCEYWFDHDFNGRQSVALAADGTWSTEFDLADFPMGVHVIGVRVGDSEGLWSFPVIRHFIRTAEIVRHTATPATLTYWIDYDYLNATTVALDADGCAALELDLSGLARGVHTFSYRIADSDGLVGTMVTKHFIIPGLPDVVGDQIVAYEYWFNHGPRRRVEVDDPAAVVTLQDVWIAVEDVRPYSIPTDYTFDVATGTVHCPAQTVRFGIQVVDNADHASAAVESEDFTMDIDLRPDFLPLPLGEITPFTSPAAGCIAGYKVEVGTADTLRISVAGPKRKLDLYGADGTRLAATTTTITADSTDYTLLAPPTTVYALLHSVTGGEGQAMSILAYAPGVTGIDAIHGTATLRAYGADGALVVETSAAADLRVFAPTGTLLTESQAAPGRNVIPLPAGIYVVKVGDASAIKVIVR